MILVFDTETTGIANLRLPYDHPSQPRIVQLGAILFDEAWRVRGELNVILKPDHFTIPAEASNIHGITQEIAERFGVSRPGALMMFAELMARCKIGIAHNSDFDAFMLEIEADRHVVEISHPRMFCTMRLMTPICKLPGNYGNYKWPRLEEAYYHAFQEKFDGAHDAMADLRACARLYRWILAQQKRNAEAEDLISARKEPNAAP